MNNDKNIFLYNNPVIPMHETRSKSRNNTTIDNNLLLALSGTTTPLYDICYNAMHRKKKHMLRHAKYKSKCKDEEEDDECDDELSLTSASSCDSFDSFDENNEELLIQEIKRSRVLFKKNYNKRQY